MSTLYSEELLVYLHKKRLLTKFLYNYKHDTSNYSRRDNSGRLLLINAFDFGSTNEGWQFWNNHAGQLRHLSASPFITHSQFTAKWKAGYYE